MRHGFLLGKFMLPHAGHLFRALQAVPVGTPTSDADYWEDMGEFASMGDAVAESDGAVLDCATAAPTRTQLKAQPAAQRTASPEITKRT